MTSDRKKPGVAFWATVVVVVVLSYPISFGPTCWLVSLDAMPESAVRAASTVYAPLIRCAANERHSAAQALAWWASVIRKREAGSYRGLLMLWHRLPAERWDDDGF